MRDLQRELSRTKEDLAAAQHIEHISDSIEMDPYTSGASKGKEPARLYTFDEPIRQESPVDHPVPQQSTPRREQPSLTGKANYRSYGQNVKHLMNQNLLEQVIEGHAGDLPADHLKYHSLEVLKGDAQLMIANAASAKITENLFSRDPEPERIWKSLRDQVTSCF
ncbi:hypothetical protein PENFLA_c012G10996 [Penicillium flavigenum]|uniref:Uncharacterized protein n=1 Tax=Penicillium flavigenum TaxID=254877 RepID=A0A1V6T8Y1_9EURO|nr:hypothetical protein PENFLA_c012G10996 [Penicillium flavigenum]